MKLPISDRLLACARFVAPGDRVADIGCDHGYLSIHLLTEGIASSCIASDINEGPLQSAMRNARKFGVSDKTFQLCQGFLQLRIGVYTLTLHLDPQALGDIAVIGSRIRAGMVQINCRREIPLSGTQGEAGLPDDIHDGV